MLRGRLSRGSNVRVRGMHAALGAHAITRERIHAYVDWNVQSAWPVASRSAWCGRSHPRRTLVDASKSYHRTVEVEGRSIDVPLLPDGAADSLDGLAKEVYTRVFEWLVDKINESTHCARGALSGTINLLVRCWRGEGLLKRPTRM